MRGLTGLKNYLEQINLLQRECVGLLKQLGDNSLLAIGTVVPPIRQDEEDGRE